MSIFAAYGRAVACCLLGLHFLLVAARFDASECLCSENDGANRQVSYAGHSSDIIIEHSNRVPHRLLNFILAYITRDILGYEVEFNEVRLGANDSLSADATLCRMSAIEALRDSQGDTKCKFDAERRFPASMVNVELWGLPGFNIENWVRMKKVIDAGPLGAFARFGWFVPTAFVQRQWQKNLLVADHFRALTDANFASQLPTMTARGCMGRLLFRSEACSMPNESACASLYTFETNSDIHTYLRAVASRFRLLIAVRFLNESQFEDCVSDALLNDTNVLFFTYAPHPLTIVHNVTRIRLPECTQIAWQPQNRLDVTRSNGVRTNNTSTSGGTSAAQNASLARACDDACELIPCEVHQLTKVIWWPLRDSAKAVFQLLTKFSFTQAEYDQLVVDLYAFLANATRRASRDRSSPSPRTGNSTTRVNRSRDRDRLLKEFACAWLRRKDNEARWQSWLGLRTNRDVVYLGGMFEMTGKWEHPGMLIAAELAIEHVRRAKDALPNLHASHTLALLARDTRCQADVAMEAFIYYVTGFEHNRANSSLIDIPFQLVANGVCTAPVSTWPAQLASSGANATCERTPKTTSACSVAPLPSSRDPLNPDAVVGILGPDVSDTADPVAHVAKHFHRVVVSPVAESYMLQDATKYPYFLSVIPHRGLFTPLYVGFFERMGWRRVAAITDNLHFVHFDTLRAKEIEVFEHNLLSPAAAAGGDAPPPHVAGAAFGFSKDVDAVRRQAYVAKTALFLNEVEKKRYRIVLADIFEDVARIMLCTAYHRRMTSRYGYVWIFPSWLSDDWWSHDVLELPLDVNATLGQVHSSARNPLDAETGRRLACSVEQMNEAADLHFTISPATLRSSGDPTRLVNNATVDTWRAEYAAAIEQARVATARNREFNMKQSKFAGFAYDTVWLYALALDRLVARKATILSELHNEQHASLFIETIKNVSFEGATGLVKFNDTNRYGVIQLIQFVYSPRNPDTHRRRRNAADASASASAPAVLNGTRGTRKPTTGSTVSAIWHSNLVGVYDYESRHFILAGDQPQGVRRTDLIVIKWTNNRPPGDGSTEAPGPVCAVEGFRVLLPAGVSCEVAIVLVCLSAFFAFLLVIAVAVIIMFRRKNMRIREMQGKVDKLRKLEALETELERFELSEDVVVRNRCLGEGAFGMVYGGEAYIGGSWRAVAIKTLKQGASLDERMNFLAEAKLMSKFEHKNIVKLLGVCRRNEPVVIMEFMLYGDLKTFLLARRALVQQALANQAKTMTSFATRAMADGNDSCKDTAVVAAARRERVRTCSSSIDTVALRGEFEDVSARRLTRMALDVANALKYLASFRYVHRDVACRNCLISDTKTVKLADFGMCRLLSDENKDYYRFSRQGMLPVRWMSPESLTTGHFSFASDVWSYGVLLYEIVTFGNFPYQGRSNSEVMQFVKQGGTLEVPCEELPADCESEPLSVVANPTYVQSAFVPSGSIRMSKAAAPGRPASDVFAQTGRAAACYSLANLMKSCWQYLPENRPSIQRIVEVLDANPELIEPHVDQPYLAVPTEPSEVKVALSRAGQSAYSAGSPSLSMRSRAHPTTAHPGALNVTPSNSVTSPTASNSRQPVATSTISNNNNNATTTNSAAATYHRQPSLSVCHGRQNLYVAGSDLKANDGTQMWHSSNSIHALTFTGNLTSGHSLPGLNRIQVNMHAGTPTHPAPAKNGSLSTLKNALFSSSKRTSAGSGPGAGAGTGTSASTSRRASKLSGKLRKSSHTPAQNATVDAGWRSAGSPDTLHRSYSQSNSATSAVQRNNNNNNASRAPTNLPLNALASTAAYINVMRMQSTIMPTRPAALGVRSGNGNSNAYTALNVTAGRQSPDARSAKADGTPNNTDCDGSQETPDSLLLGRRPDALTEEATSSQSDNEASTLEFDSRVPHRDDVIRLPLGDF